MKLVNVASLQGLAAWAACLARTRFAPQQHAATSFPRAVTKAAAAPTLSAPHSSSTAACLPFRSHATQRSLPYLASTEARQLPGPLASNPTGPFSFRPARPSFTAAPIACPFLAPTFPASASASSSSSSTSSSFSTYAAPASASATASTTGPTSSPTPAELGFRMPGEFERHAGTWLAFPYNPAFWRDGARPAQAQMVDLAKAVAQFEPVWMLADPEVAPVARSQLQGIPGVEVVEVPTNDIWIRDWGPTCIVRDDPASGRREVAAVRWDYNCYGAPIKMAAGLPVLMTDWSKDRAAGRWLPERHGLRSFDCALHLEGGSVHSDGEGTLLVTEECLLHPSRNPHLTRTQIEAQLCAFLGASKVLWLLKGMAGDEEGTNGHVDNVACFSEPSTVLLAWSDDPDDPMWSIARHNLAVLKGATDARGRPIRIIQVPCPEPPVVTTKQDVTGLAAAAAGTGYGKIYEPKAGVRLPGSYLNHYIVNGGVLVPQFGGEQSQSDAAALAVLSAAYPDRRVVGVQTRELLLNGGNIHCLTQQLPAP